MTDFNIATILEDGKLATSMSGTKPYMGEYVVIISNKGFSGGVRNTGDLMTCFMEALFHGIFFAECIEF